MKRKNDPTEHIKQLTKIGIALSAEKDINNFFNLILDEALRYTNSDGATIYTTSEDKRFLDFKIVCTISKNLKLGIADTTQWPSVPLYDSDGNKNLKNIASYVAHTGESTNIDDVYDQTIYDNSGTLSYDKANDYRTKSIVSIPLKNHENDVLGVIQLINAMDEDGEIISFTKAHITMLTSLASQAAIALTNRKLIDGLENLLQQFIKSIAKAIDRKSEYTGGHITRVATLTEMISEAIQKDNENFKNVKFSEEELDEISIAGWMHDIGKITTPIYIMDKATKLETLLDRVQLIEARFELIKLAVGKDMINSDEEKKEDLKALLERIDNYWKFIRKANIGGEFMKDGDIARIDEIFEFSYQSNGKTYNLLTEDEKTNLKIRRGTLLSEEINMMREHVIVTHEMLSQLTFPKKYKNVPLYASAHHEKLNGKGYPFHLEEKDLPLQARIIAVADLFEALTAADRPYKKGKPLSETFKILGFMAKDKEIDKDILKLLIDSKIYLNYARQYLNPEQLDEIDFDELKNKISD
ncbi:MAG: HD domain-containing protein [Candidatus Cloacimonetes bacterium]|nr:HD domain-containing protein [Candidatus Cloacimonadota bacterium]